MSKDKTHKPKIDKNKLFVRIMASVLAGIMVLGFAATLIFYLVGQK